ncbi:MAG: adenine-specific methyltransferase EcoRI family protein [Sphaerochaeta sp.]|jgi:hypothetical protein|nr:adenine-specific methyltransferase EcoRI family protein [Sphaerochaeta sp.]
MKGHQIAGTSENRERVDNDYYATPEASVKALLEREAITYPVLEPACGDGAISRLLTGGRVASSDLIDRGFGVGGIDFLTNDWNDTHQTVITNPPFSLFTEFVKKGLEVAQEKLILFGKLQALEGEKRGTYLATTPLRTVYVFKKRQNPLRNGVAVDENGKPWASTMAFAWFVWEKGYIGKPTIEWI